MANNGQKKSSEDVFSNKKQIEGRKRAGRDIWQDKYAPNRVRAGSSEPVTVDAPMRTHASNTKPARSQNRSKKRRTVQVASWVREHLRDQIQRFAKKEGLSTSKTIAALLEEAVRQKLHIQHAVLLQPIIEQTIRKEMRAIATKLAWLIVRVAFDAGQTRSLVTNILGRQPGVTPEVLQKILEGSSKTARGNIIRKTPQIKELVKAIEDWLMEEGESGYTKN
jgi:hypothetical protein